MYLLGYTSQNIEEKNGEIYNSREVEKFSSKYRCEFETITNEDIYKVKAIIVDNIKAYLKSISH